MAYRKHLRNKIQDIAVKDVVKILGLFFSAENEASIPDQNWNTKLDNLIRSKNGGTGIQHYMDKLF